jgi:hypothetical protein
MQNANGSQRNQQSQKQGILYVVETQDSVFYSDRKIDAVYKHCEFLYGRARYKEVDRSKYQFPEGKRRIKLRDGTVTEA